MNVAAIITDEAGNVLLGVPLRGTHRHFPQGGVKAHESPADALEREVREEVGLRHCRVLAEYPGLRYAYRRKNEKSKRWLGQQQTYYLLRCPGIAPPTDCTGSAEFARAEWVPLAELKPEIFVAFKRAVVAQALAHFFPDGAAEPALNDCTISRYIHHPGQAPSAPAATPLFAGKREEALYHLVHTAPLRLRKKQRLLVVLVGMEGSGIKKCLRHIAHSLDPLTTRYHLYAKDYSVATPGAGELSFLVLRGDESEKLRAYEAEMQAQGVQVLKVALHLSRAKQLRRLSRKDETPARPWAIALRDLLSFMESTPTPWYLLPAEHGWYRDFLLHTLLREKTKS